MSSLLEQAIVDAKALKEAALKNAEASIVEKYSDEVKKTLDQLLEQDELGLGGPPMADPMGAPPVTEAPGADIDVPLGAAEGEKLCPCPDEGEATQIDIDFDELSEALQRLQEEVAEVSEEAISLEEEDDDVEITEEDLKRILSGEEPLQEEEIEEVNDPGSFAGEEADEEESDDDDSAAALAGSAAAEEADSDAMKGITEDGKIDALVDAIAEKLTVDMGATLSGWAGRSSESMKWEMEKELAHRRSTEFQEELEDLKKAQEELVFENKQLQETIQNYQSVVEQLKETVSDVNLSNARLLYTNRVLRNTSLNERQKIKIVETISQAGSVKEAKMIFETLQSTVQAKPKRSPKSLSEAINRPSSVIRAAQHRETQTVDPVAERMKKLAGIN